MSGVRAGDFCKIAFLNRQHMCAIFRSAVQFFLRDSDGPATFHTQDEPVAERPAYSLSVSIQQQEIAKSPKTLAAGRPSAYGYSLSPMRKANYLHLQPV